MEIIETSDSSRASAVSFLARICANAEASKARARSSARIVIESEACRAHRIPPRPVAAAAALPADLRRLLLLITKGRGPDGLPAWARAWQLGWPPARVVSGLLALVRRRLALMKARHDPADLDAILTDAGRRDAALVSNWRTWP